MSDTTRSRFLTWFFSSILKLDETALGELTKKGPYKKRSLRFDPDRDSAALFSRDLSNTDFSTYLTALPVDESFTGVGLVMLAQHGVQVGDKLIVKVGKLAPLVGIVRWVGPLDKDIVRVGFQYTE
jgi:hypothetical protein